MFNLQGSELIIILLLALVVLGPEKLPDAMRKAGQIYAELKKMSSGFQSEFRAAVEEPLNELKNTANTLRDSADFTKLQTGERDEKPKSAEMVAAADPSDVPVDDLPFGPDSGDTEQSLDESDAIVGDAGDGADEQTASIPPQTAPIPPPPKPFSSSQKLSSSPRSTPEPTGASGDQPLADEGGSDVAPVDAGSAESDLAATGPSLDADDTPPPRRPQPFSSSQKLSTSPRPSAEDAESTDDAVANVPDADFSGDRPPDADGQHSAESSGETER